MLVTVRRDDTNPVIRDDADMACVATLNHESKCGSLVHFISARGGLGYYEFVTILRCIVDNYAVNVRCHVFCAADDTKCTR